MTQGRLEPHAPSDGRIGLHLTHDELSLLLYLETCAVDQRGLVESVRMNAADFEIVKRWNEKGFLQFGRIAARDIKPSGRRIFTHWVVLSNASWTVAHTERRDRAARGIAASKIRRIKAAEKRKPKGGGND